MLVDKEVVEHLPQGQYSLRLRHRDREKYYSLG